MIKDGAQYAAYSYDANSNRTAKTVEGATQYATFDSRDRMNTQGDLDLTYNANGELTEKRDRVTGETLALDYTTLGGLKSATTPDGDQIEYLLDGAGRRVGKKVDSQLVQGLLYSPEAYGPVAELDGSNNLVSRFIYGRSSNVPDYMVKGGVNYRLITDQLGSVVLVVDASTGAIAQEISYGPFGEVMGDSNPGFQPFGFAGGIHDTDTGLTHFGAREYDAGLGRWMASDPIGFNGGDSNLYGYVIQDPVDFVDPSGLEIEGQHEARPAPPEPEARTSYSYCVGGNAHFFFGGQLKACWNDTPQGSGVTAGWGIGTGMGAALDTSFNVSNARCLKALTGKTAEIGGGLGPFGASYSTDSEGSGGGGVGIGGGSAGVHGSAYVDVVEMYRITGSSKACMCMAPQTEEEND